MQLFVAREPWKETVADMNIISERTHLFQDEGIRKLHSERIHEA